MSKATHADANQAGTRADSLLSELFGGAVEDPYPLYEELRELGDGIHFSDYANAYVVCRYDDVRRIGSDPQVFSSDLFWQSPQSAHDPSDPEQARFVDLTSRLFMFSDPPFHTRIRSSFRKAFTPQAMQAWRPVVQQVTAEFIDCLRGGDEVDVMLGLAADVPVAIIAAILGVPAEKRGRFREWSMAYASTFDPMVQGERRDAVIATSLELMDYLGELVAQRRLDPSDDLITLLVQAETITGDHLEDVELIAQLTLLLAAGNETTTNLIGSGLTLLLAHPEAKARLIAEPDRWPGAIEEMLRYDPPLHLIFRKTASEAQLGEHLLPAGTMLLACPPAANHDPRRFAKPAEFDIERADNRHLAFFHGIHFCVGAALARLEGAVVFEQLLRCFPEISVGSRPAVRRTSNSTVRGWETRPVRL